MEVTARADAEGVTSGDAELAGDAVRVVPRRVTLGLGPSPVEEVIRGVVVA